ncbi:MAG: hypothetical protein AAB368_04800, partial [bacterium]
MLVLVLAGAAAILLPRFLEPERLRALVERATPGPWSFGVSEDASLTWDSRVLRTHKDGGLLVEVEEIARVPMLDDRRLIVAAVNALPDLLDAA